MENLLTALGFTPADDGTASLTRKDGKTMTVTVESVEKHFFMMHTVTVEGVSVEMTKFEAQTEVLEFADL